MSDDDYRVLPEFPLYRIYRDGRIESHKGKFYSTHGRPPTVVLRRFKGTQVTSRRVRNLVCEAFNGPPPFKGAQVESKSGNNGSIHADDLEWILPSWNRSTSVPHGFTLNSQVEKLQLPEVQRMLQTDIKAGTKHWDIAYDYGVSVRALHKVLGITADDTEEKVQEHEDQIMNWRKLNWPMSRIAYELDVPVYVVQQFLSYQ